MEIRTLSRALSVLKYVGDAATGASHTEISASVGLSKATTHRMLQALLGEGFVRCDPLTGYYVLGPQFHALAQQADPFGSIKRASRPVLELLRDQTQETVALVVRDHDERIALDVQLSPHELKAAPPVGSRKPIHAGAAGKALLALSPVEELEAIAARSGLPRLTRTTVTSIAEFKREIAKVRKDGYARSLEEAVEGQSAVGIPIVSDDRVVAALNICGPSPRMTQERIERFVKHGLAAARRIAAELSATGASSGGGALGRKSEKPAPRAKPTGRRTIGVK
jgi:DNA-binding IclR family transcriptional regulator